MLEQTTTNELGDVIGDTHEPHTLACDMTEAELQDEQANLLRLLQDIEDLELQKKSVVADFGARKNKLAEMMEESRKKLRSKEVMRSIMCILQFNFTKLVATLTREDSGERVSERPMTGEEKRLLNATPTLPGMEEVSGINPEMTGDPIEPETNLTPTDPPEGEPLTEEEADVHATEKFGPELSDDDKLISDAADLSEDEPKEEYNFGLNEEETE